MLGGSEALAEGHFGELDAQSGPFTRCETLMSRPMSDRISGVSHELACWVKAFAHHNACGLAAMNEAQHH